MSLPEAQPEYNYNSRADSYNRLDTVLLLHNVEQLRKTAESCGALAIIGANETEIDADISEGGIRLVNLLDQPIVQFEAANFYMCQEDSLLAYRIRHNTETAVRGAERQSLLREYWLFYEQPDEARTAIFDSTKSRYRISLDMVGSSESVRLLPNEGTPLQPLEQKLFDNCVTQLGAMNGYQFREIEQLVIRAIDSVNAS